MKQRSSRIANALGGCLERLYRDRSGATATFVAAGMLAMAGTMGLATDAARGYLVKARLSQALDAAALAGGRAMFSPDQNADILKYFYANFPQGYMGAQVTAPTINVTNNTLIDLSASATIPTTLMRLFGHETIEISASTQVTRATNSLDVVLAIDMSGSMTGSAGGGQTRIEAARGAATQLVNILFGEAAIASNLNIGVVPWNSKVNATINGTTFDPGLTVSEAVTPFTNPLTGNVQSVIWKANNSPAPLLDQPQSDWKGCVYSRYIHPGLADDDDGDIQLYDVSSPVGDWVAWEPIKTAEGEPTPSFWTHCQAAEDDDAPGWSDCGPCLSHGITPLNSTKQSVLDAIDALQSPTGQTNIPQGLGWGWRVLMPGEPFNQANPSPSGFHQRAIVLLTDGENVGGYGDGYKAIFGLNSNAQDDMDGRLLTLSQNIKASGVLIYTIQFANSGTGMQDLLKAVATSPDPPFYNYAPDGAALQQIFQEIANHLSQLHLSM